MDLSRKRQSSLTLRAVMPNCTSKTFRRMEGSTQSNAALKVPENERCDEAGVKECDNVVVDM